MIRKKDNRWLADVRIGGRDGKRYKRLFDSKTEAKRFEVYVLNERRKDSEWTLTKTRDQRRLDDLIGLWFNYHGKNLKESHNRTHQLYIISKIIGNPKLCDMNKKTPLDYRAKRTDICANTLNCWGKVFKWITHNSCNLRQGQVYLAISL